MRSINPAILNINIETIMEFKSYHKIRQFKDVVRDIQHIANFKGIDVDKKPIYEESSKPTISFKGTVKLHGTNAGICYDPKNGIVAQKRSSFLKGDDIGSHMGFNDFVNHIEKESFIKLMDNLWNTYCEIGEQITLYGEWAGVGIQKGVAISQLNKSFYIFDCKIYNSNTDENRWIDVSELRPNIDNVYNIHQFKTFCLDIDFNNPQLSQNTLKKITEEVERECPVSKELGQSGVGEGVVWTGFWNDQKYIFKVKGEKHSTTKVKTLASVNPEVLKSINDFVEYACTQNRIEQGIKEINATEKKHMPDLLRWVANDILSEESDTLKSNGLEWKQVAKDCSNRVRQYFFLKLDTV